MWSQNFATLQSTTAKSSGKTSKESLRSCKEYVKRFPFVPRDEFWGQRNGTQLSFPQLAGSRLIGPSGAEQAWFDDLPVASLHRSPVTKPDWNDDVSKRWATRQEASEVSDPSDGRRPSGLRTSRSSLNKCLVQTRSAIPQREIKTGSETDGCISCLLICGLSGSSALRRFLSLDGRSPHKC